MYKLKTIWVVCQICGKAEKIDQDKPIGHFPRWTDVDWSYFIPIMHSEGKLWLCPKCAENHNDLGEYGQLNLDAVEESLIANQIIAEKETEADEEDGGDIVYPEDFKQ